jgi:hypothetical protein
MKKILVFALLSIAMFSTVLAQGVYNGDFEAWENRLYYEDPDGYVSANAQIYMMQGTPNVSKSTDAADGMYSLKLQTIKVMNDTVFGFAVYGNPGDEMDFSGGFAFTEMPDSFKAHVKYDLANNDSALVLLLFKKNGVVINMQMIPFYGTQNTWTEMAFKLNTFGQAPDSAIIGFASSNPESDITRPNPGNWLMVDNVRFTGAGTAIPNHSFETWNSLSSMEPLGWNTMNLFFLLEGKQPNVTKATDAYEGNSALSVKTAALSLFGGDLDTMGIATTGSIGDFGFAGGFPMSKKPDSLSFYYKYNNSNNLVDMALVYTAFSKYNSTLKRSETIDSAMMFLPGAFNWTRKTMAFNAASGIPDTSNILLLSSNIFFGTHGLGNELLIDEMIYWYGSVGIPVIADGFQKMKVYPNPVTTDLHLDIVLQKDEELFVNVYTLNGQKLYARKYLLMKGKHTLVTDVSDLPKGNFILSVESMDGKRFSDTFIK